MQVVAQIEYELLRVIFWGLIALRVWAFVDCLIRKTAAFPAAGKLTKPAWVLLTGFSLAISALLHIYGPYNFLTLAFLVVSLVYLTDVRPAVREVSGGSRW